MDNTMLRDQIAVLFQFIEEHEISDPVRTTGVDLSVDQQVEMGEKAMEALRALTYIKDSFVNDIAKAKEKIDGLTNDIAKSEEKIEKLSAIEARLKSQIFKVMQQILKKMGY